MDLALGLYRATGRELLSVLNWTSSLVGLLVGVPRATHQILFTQVPAAVGTLKNRVLYLIHGSFASPTMWAGHLEAIQKCEAMKDFCIRLPKFNTGEGLGPAIAEMKAELQGIEEVYLAGHSWGGILSAHLAFVDRLENIKGIDLVASRLATNPQDVFYNWLHDLWQRAGIFEAERPFIERIFEALKTRGIGNIKVRVWYGKHDWLVPPSATFVPGAGMHMIEGSGHLDILWQTIGKVGIWAG